MGEARKDASRKNRKKKSGRNVKKPMSNRRRWRLKRRKLLREKRRKAEGKANPTGQGSAGGRKKSAHRGDAFGVSKASINTGAQNIKEQAHGKQNVSLTAPATQKSEGLSEDGNRFAASKKQSSAAKSDAEAEPKKSANNVLDIDSLLGSGVGEPDDSWKHISKTKVAKASKKTHRMKIGLTEGQYQVLKQKAKMKHVTLSRLVREALFGGSSAGRESSALKEIDSLYEKKNELADYLAGHADAMNNLVRVGTNLNQIAHAINANRFNVSEDTLQELNKVLYQVDSAISLKRVNEK